MRLIDILNKVANKENGYFKFNVRYDVHLENGCYIEWIYDNGVITTNDDKDNIFYFLKTGIYELNNKIVILGGIYE